MTQSTPPPHDTAPKKEPTTPQPLSVTSSKTFEPQKPPPTQEEKQTSDDAPESALAEAKKTNTNFESMAKKALRQGSWTPMREELGPFWGWLANRYFQDISITDERLEQLHQASEEGTIVYIARSQSYLNYLIYNDLFIRKDLPLARMGYGLHWLPWLPLTSQLRAFAGWLGRLFGDGGKDVVELFRELLRHGDSTLFFLKQPNTWHARIRRGLYNIRNKMRAWFGKPPAPGGRNVDLFLEMIELQRQQDRPLILAPQILIWSRLPTSSKQGFGDFFFGEPEFPGLLRESYLFLRERRRSWVRGGAPIHLKQYIEEHKDLDNETLAEKLRDELSHRLDREYRAVTGPVRKPTEELKEQVLRSPMVRQAIMDEALAADVPPEKIKQKTRAMLDRMAADIQLSIATRVDIILRRLWRRMYNRIQVDEKGLEKVREASIKGPIILIPSHKSHIDYLILSQLFYHYDLGLPVIAAGDNLLLPVIGSLLRKSGAFFIRRSFKGDALYTALFRAYIWHLIRQGFTVEFFIEGGRSRTGKLRMPRVGMLAAIMDLVFEEDAPDIHIAPVSIGYEKIIEGEAYTKELLGGDKKKESFGDLLRARRFVKLNFGSINISFAEPIPVKEYIAQRKAEEQKPNAPYQPEHNLKDREHLTQTLAYTIVHEINRVSFITPTSLVTTILLTHENRGIRHNELIEKVEWLCKEVIERGGHIAPIEDISALIDRTVEFLGSKLLKNPKNLLEPVYKPRASRWLELGYYRNQLIHLFTSEGMVACALSGFKQFRTEDKGVPKDVLLEEVRFLSQILKLEFIFKPTPDIQDNFSETLDFLRSKGLFTESTEFIKVRRSRDELFMFLQALFGPFIDSYWVASLGLMRLLQGELNEAELIKLMQMTSETLYHEGLLRYSESVSKDTLKNALMLFQDLNVITSEKRPEKGSNKRTEKIYRIKEGFHDEEILLAFVKRIGKMSSCFAINDVIERLHERNKTSMQIEVSKDTHETAAPIDTTTKQKEREAHTNGRSTDQTK